MHVSLGSTDRDCASRLSFPLSGLSTAGPKLENESLGDGVSLGRLKFAGVENAARA